MEWLPEIDIHQLRNEYIIFSRSFDDLSAGINLPTLLHCLESKSSSESCEEEENITEDGQNNMTKICVGTILHTLSKYDLSAAFTNLYIVYKVLGTIPVTSASAERSFSKVSLLVDFSDSKI